MNDTHLASESETQDLLPAAPDPGEKQSVRTTFKMSPEAYWAKTWLANHWGGTEKDAIDQVTSFLGKVSPQTLESIEDQLGVHHRPDRMRKTQVLSKGALRFLESKAAEMDITRDDLLGRGLVVVEGMIKRALEEQFQNHSQALDLIRTHSEQAKKLERQLSELLGKDDAVYSRFSSITMSLINLIGAVETELEDGTPVDPNGY